MALTAHDLLMDADLFRRAYPDWPSGPSMSAVDLTDYEPELDEGEEPYWFLHVEKEEAHSPGSLHARNAEFYALAEEHDLLSYDGMDVGPIEAPGPTH